MTEKSRLTDKYPPKMKNKFFAALLLIVIALAVTSCASSRKTGCPGNPNANYKFKG